ncbi:hypothetical protein ACN42_g10040 [Penicillium freii]|uniref:Uncharacterized protein n=1 Tax=Penicillium freii TaxID=48697 RepID=A0A101MAS5_PENFR|nr:hypothetical protein ACN42_g10040 [Penicillium freii]
MSEQLPPSGPGGGRHDGGRHDDDRHDGDRYDGGNKRSMHRQNAAQDADQAAAQISHDARVAALIVQAVQHQVDQEGFRPSPARDARVAELTVRALDAQVDLRRESGRRGRGGGGRHTTREGGRGGYYHRGGYGTAYRAGIVDAGQQNPRSDQVLTQQYPGHQVVREAASSGPWSWTGHQTRLEDMAGKSDLLL